MLIKSCFSMENDGKILSHNAEINPACFFFLCLLAAKEMQRPSETWGAHCASTANRREPLSSAGKHLLR